MSHAADQLYQQILEALRNQNIFGANQLLAALLAAEPDSYRTLVIAGVVRFHLYDYAGAERHFEQALQDYGPAPEALTNLSKVYLATSRESAGLETLRKALKIDPNQFAAVVSYAKLLEEANGSAGLVAALVELAEDFGSCLAKLYLARHALDEGDEERALALYENAADGELSSDALLMISGDLGARGRHDWVRRFVADRYDPERHSPDVGVNLVTSLAASGDRQGAVDVLQAMVRALPPGTVDMASFEAFIASSPAGSA